MGLHLILWQIPVLKALNDCPDAEPVRQDWEEAIARGYVVRHTDGSPYVIPDKWFAGSLLPDFTNPEACRWWFDKRRPLLEMGVEGFKTDGGEFLFGSDVRLADGTPGVEAHNRYPMQYEKAYHDWLQVQRRCGRDVQPRGIYGRPDRAHSLGRRSAQHVGRTAGSAQRGSQRRVVRRAVLEL